MISHRHWLRRLIILVLLFNISFAGFCSKSQIATVRSVLKGAPILTNRLVSAGKITQAQADGAVRDFLDGVDVAVSLGQGLEGATTSQQKYAAAHTAFTGWLVIYNRGHFGVHPDVRNAADLASGVFEFIDAFYGDKAGVASHSDVGVDGLSDDEFKDVLDQKIRQLKAAMR